VSRKVRPYHTADDALIEFLAQLRSSQFFSAINVYEKYSNCNVTHTNFGQYALDYYLILKGLKKYGASAKLKVRE